MILWIIGNIKFVDTADGEGVRVSLFVSGCRNHCKGCFSKVTWDFNYGQLFTAIEENEIKSQVPSTYVVVGTYSRQVGKVILNARVMDNVSGKIISSARASYNHGLANDCMMFRDCAPTRTINIVKER